MKAIGFLLLAMAAQQALAKSRLTPLRIDNYACKPEILKNQVRYLCDDKGNVTCNHGWSKDNDTDSSRNPCTTPVCSQGCTHGRCKSPGTCACDIGWEGNDCNACVTLPGCVHGSCNGSALACVCTNSTLYSGGLCDTPVCENCVHGQCIAPGVCKCNPGWGGDNCSTCVPLKGCSPIGGGCVDPQNPSIQAPSACLCKNDYTGPLCDQPKCTKSCSPNGECIFAYANMTTPICKCKLGWTGDDCKQCLVYTGCPRTCSQGGCTKPFECKCANGDNNPVCDIHLKN